MAAPYGCRPNQLMEIIERILSLGHYVVILLFERTRYATNVYYTGLIVSSIQSLFLILTLTKYHADHSIEASRHRQSLVKVIRVSHTLKCQSVAVHRLR